MNKVESLMILFFTSLLKMAWAQPIVDSNWFYPFTTSCDRFSTNITSPGSSGFGQIWDYSYMSLLSDSMHADFIFQPNGVVIFNDTVDYKIHLSNGIYPASFDAVDYYLEKNTDSLVERCFQKFSYVGGSTFYNTQEYNLDPVLVLRFPFTYMTSDSNSYYRESGSSSQIPGGTVYITEKVYGSRTFLVDGYGDLILLDGVHPGSYRVKYIDTQLDSSLVGPPVNISSAGTIVKVRYSFFTTDNGLLQERLYIQYDSLLNNQPVSNPYIVSKYYSPISLVGLNNLSTNNLLFLYPNPANESVYFTGSELLPGFVQVRVFNLLGEQLIDVISNVIINTPLEIIIKEIPTGYYIINVIQKDKVWQSSFVKL
jgi:hypothetical protein